MARPIVHIGYHKTATTWFQKSVYPLARSHRYVPRDRANPALLEASAFHFDAEAARSQLGLAGDAPPIVCEEALSGALLSGGYRGFQSAAIAHRIRAVFPDARIVVFVRSQPEIVAATYLQYVRVGGTYSPRRFLWPRDYALASPGVPRREPQFSFDHFDYDRLIAHYTSVFGASSVSVFAYEELRRGGRAFLERFAKTLALDLRIDEISMEKRNASYSVAVARIARLLNRFTAHSVLDKHHWVHVPRWYRTRKKLLEALSARPIFGARATPEQLLGEPALRWIGQRYWESNRRLADLTGLDLRALGYPMDPPSAAVPLPPPDAWQRWVSH
jgi:hypothetical protein